MSRGQKYRKLIVANGERVTAKNSLAGMLCISDYRDTASTRTLVFERPDKAAAVESPKPVTRKKRQPVNGAEQPQEGGLAFPGETAPGV